MKTIIVLLCVLAAHGLPASPATEDEALKTACIEESGVDPKTLQQSIVNVIDRYGNPKIKEFTFCYAKKIGFITDQGQINLDIVQEKLADVPPADKESLIKKCVIKKDTPQETAYASFFCFHDNIKRIH